MQAAILQTCRQNEYLSTQMFAFINSLSGLIVLTGAKTLKSCPLDVRQIISVAKQSKYRQLSKLHGNV